MKKERVKTEFEKVYDDHLKWIKTVRTLGATKEEAEDVVGEMYITIGTMLNKGLDISYKGQVNYYYIYLTLRSRYFNMIKKRNRMQGVPVEDCSNLASSPYINFEEFQEKLETELKKMNWYDAKVFNLIQGGYTLVELSKLTGISYHSLYHTNRNTKNNLKNKVL